MGGDFLLFEAFVAALETPVTFAAFEPLAVEAALEPLGMRATLELLRVIGDRIGTSTAGLSARLEVMMELQFR